MQAAAKAAAHATFGAAACTAASAAYAAYSAAASAAAAAAAIAAVDALIDAYLADGGVADCAARAQRECADIVRLSITWPEVAGLLGIAP